VDDKGEVVLDITSADEPPPPSKSKKKTPETV
jgi:hypothetical protein